MFNDDLTKAEDRWHKRQMFRPRHRRRGSVVVRLVLVAALGVLFWYAYHVSGQIPWDQFKVGF